MNTDSKTSTSQISTGAPTATITTVITSQQVMSAHLLRFPLAPPPTYSPAEREEFLRLSVEHGQIATEWHDLVESCGRTMCAESKRYATEKVKYHSGEARRLLVLGRPELTERLVGEGMEVEVSKGGNGSCK